MSVKSGIITTYHHKVVYVHSVKQIGKGLTPYRPNKGQKSKEIQSNPKNFSFF